MPARKSRAGAGYMNHQVGSRRWLVAEDDVPGGRPVGAAAPVVALRSPWVVLFALFGAALIAYHWATACPAKPLATFFVDQAKAIGWLLIVFALPGALLRKNPLPELRNYALPWAPMYLVGLVPAVVSMTVGWEGGWILGIAGAAAGAAAGAVAGWLFTRWTLPDIENRQRERGRANQLPIVFAVLFGLRSLPTIGQLCGSRHWTRPGYSGSSRSSSPC